MFFSFYLSKALVDSSSNKIWGFFNKALAIAILYFCPPENCYPKVPISVSSLLGVLSIKFHALADFKDSIIRSSVAFGLAYNIFYLIVVLNKTGSYSIYPIYYLRFLRLYSLIFLSSINNSPYWGS